MSSSRLRRTAAVALLPALLLACRQIPERPGRDVAVLSDPDTTQLAVVDVVVPPIQNNTADPELPLEELREQFQAGLVRLRYSPLALDYVDSRVVDASYTPGSLQEEAVFQVTINAWDESGLRTNGLLHVDCEAALLDPTRPDPASALWRGQLNRPIQVGLSALNPSLERLREAARRELVEELLGAVPARNPRR